MTASRISATAYQPVIDIERSVRVCYELVCEALANYGVIELVSLPGAAGGVRGRRGAGAARRVFFADLLWLKPPFVERAAVSFLIWEIF